MKKYVLKDLDCPVCAQKIEDHLKSLGYDATVSFVNKSLYIKEEISLELLNKEVRSVEDEVTVVEEKEEEKDNYVPLILSVLLLVAGLLIEKSGFSLVFFIFSYLLVGYKVIVKSIKNVLHGEIFDENFLMMIATIAAFCIKEYPEAVMVMLLFEVGEHITDKAVDNSRESISDLIELKSNEATILEKDKEIVKDIHDIKIGDVMLIKQGERIALDGEVIDGEATIDTCSLTGEVTPIYVNKGEKVLSGCINVEGIIKVRVDSDIESSTVSRILSMIEDSASKKTNTERFITRFSRVYTPVVVIVALFVAIIPSLFLGDWSNWIYKAIVFLVVSCPCALVISVPLGFYMGIGACSKRGILIKGSNYLELLDKCDCVCFDKTGTITEGNFTIKEVKTKNFNEEELIEYTLNAEKGSLHPLVKALKENYSNYILNKEMTFYEEIKGLGVKSVVDGKEVLVGNCRLMKENNIKFDEEEGIVVYVSIDKKYVGCFIFEDKVKSDASKFIEELKKRNIKEIMMLSGDKKDNAAKVARELNISSLGELLPQDKVISLKGLKDKGNTCMYLGDGINDAPVLMESDVGVSMGSIGSDVAIEASDIVIVDDNPYKIIEAMDIAKKAKKIIWFNIIFALSVKFIIMLLAMFNISSLPLAVFGDVGVTIITILNCLRINKGRY